MYRFTFTLLFLFSSLFLVGQELKLDNYKYIIVADKFHFVKEVDGFQTSSLTKFLLEKKGFQVFLSNENFPDELSQNKCNNALFADVKDESDFLTTKSTIVLNDCKGNTLYTSKVGKSKLKEYKKAYQESIRNAFNTMTDINFSYKPTVTSIVLPEINKKIGDTIIEKKDTFMQYNQQFNSVPEIPDLIAQPITHGFQLVNANFEKLYIILRTSVTDFFILKDKNGFVYRKKNIWFIEFYENDKLVKYQTQIQF